MTRQVTIPFALGQDESYSPIELPTGPLRECTNVRQRALHSFGVRPDFPAVAMTHLDGGTAVPYDLYELNGKLVALGDRFSKGRPTDLLQLVQQPAGAWSGTFSGTSTGSRVAPVVKLRDVGSPTETAFDIGVARVGAMNGLVCLVQSYASNAAGNIAYASVFRASDGALIGSTSLDMGNPRVVVAGSSLWIVGVSGAADLTGVRFDTSTGAFTGGLVTLYTGTVTFNMFDAVSIKSLAQFAFIVRDGSTTVVRRFSEAGVQQQTFAGPAVAADALSIEADSAANRIVVAYRAGAADAFVQTYNLTTAASVAGPTAMFGQAVTGDLYLQRKTSGAAAMVLLAEDTGPLVRVNFFNDDSPAAGVAVSQFHYFLSGRPISNGGSIVAPMIGASGDNRLVFTEAAGDVLLTLDGASVDRGIAVNEQPGFDGVSGGDCCTDTATGKSYWAHIAESADGQMSAFVTEFLGTSTARRQSCQVGNALLIAGGVPVHYDGRQTAESGWYDRPVFHVAAVGTTVGSLIPGATYEYVFIWTYQDALTSITKSQVSEAQSVTLTLAENAVTLQPRVPRSLRYATASGGAPVVEIYRTHADEPAPGTFTRGTAFQRVAAVSVTLSDTAGSITVTDTMSDDTLLSQPPLYTQGERGTLTGILEHEAPPPFEFCTTVGQRAFIGGLPDRSEVRISKALFPGETLAFTGDSAFSARVEGDVTAVATLGGSVPLAFTSDAVYVFPGGFADDNGSNGSLGPPQRLDVEEGCSNANSICVTSVGVFYQSRTGKLMLLRPGASASQWIGRAMQATLAAFPVITGAAYVETDNAVIFQCQNTAGTASTHLVFDLLIGQWYRDTFAVAQVQRACVAHLGRLAYIDTATVRLQATSLVPATFIPYSVKTGSLNPFGGDGWGRMPSVTVPFQFRGNARMRMSVSYDDGRTFIVCKMFEFTTAGGFVADQFDREQWWPNRVKGSSYVLLFEVIADTGGTASEGLILQRYTLELDGAKPSRARLATAQKG